METDEVAYEVWREHSRGGRDVRIQGPTSRAIAESVYDEARKDKLDEYPNAPFDFYLAKVTIKRERVTP